MLLAATARLAAAPPGALAALGLVAARQLSASAAAAAAGGGATARSLVLEEHGAPEAVLRLREAAVPDASSLAPTQLLLSILAVRPPLGGLRGVGGGVENGLMRALRKPAGAGG